MSIVITLERAIDNKEDFFKMLEYSSYAANRSYGMTHEQLLSIGIAMENLLPKSIEERALNNMAKGMDAIESVKLAIEQEEDFVISLIGSGYLTERGKAIASILCKEIYNKINN